MGVWNLTRFGYGSDPQYDTPFPQVYDYDYYGQSCRIISGIDLNLEPDGTGELAYYSTYGCDVPPVYYADDLEWELNGNEIDLFTFDSYGYGDTGSGSGTSGTPMRTLLLTCTVADSTTLECGSTADEQLTFKRPFCTDDSACSPGDVCVRSQCATPNAGGPAPKVEGKPRLRRVRPLAQR